MSNQGVTVAEGVMAMKSPAMLFKIVVKEKAAQPRRPNEIFKILPSKGTLKTSATKGSAERGLHCPAAGRKWGPSCNRYKEGPY